MCYCGCEFDIEIDHLTFESFHDDFHEAFEKLYKMLIQIEFIIANQRLKTI